VALLTGGFAESELKDAGAAQIFESPEALLNRVDESPFAR